MEDKKPLVAVGGWKYYPHELGLPSLCIHCIPVGKSPCPLCDPVAYDDWKHENMEDKG